MTYVLCDLSGPVLMTAQPYFKRTAQHSTEKHTHACQSDSKCSAGFIAVLRPTAHYNSLQGTYTQLKVTVIHICILQGLCCRKVFLDDM